MSLSTLTDPLLATLGTQLPSVVAVLLILAIGWLVAVIVRAGLRRGLKALRADERLSSATQQPMGLTEGIASGGYYVVLLVTVVTAIGFLDIELATEPLRAAITPILGFLPSLIGAGIVALVAWVLATVLRKLVSATLSATTLDERLENAAGLPGASAGAGGAVFWLVLVLFAPAVLGALGLNGLLAPVEGMVATGLAMVPNIVAALVIGGVGWLLATVLGKLATQVLAGVGADRLGARVGLPPTTQPSRLGGVVVRIVVLVPALIAALDALQIAAISEPATAMLQTVMLAVPQVLAAAIILGVAWLIARLVSPLVVSLLEQLGADNLPEKLGFGAAAEGVKLSKQGGRLVTFALMLFAAVEAAARLGLSQVSELVATFVHFGGKVLLGAVILVVGLALANLAHRTMVRTGGAQASFTAAIARVAIMGLVLAMGLDAMGVAETVVTLAFGLTLGAVGVAVALAFGLGGREPAGRLVSHWTERLLDAEGTQKTAE